MNDEHMEDFEIELGVDEDGRLIMTLIWDDFIWNYPIGINIS